MRFANSKFHEVSLKSEYCSKVDKDKLRASGDDNTNATLLNSKLPKLLEGGRLMSQAYQKRYPSSEMCGKSIIIQPRAAGERDEGKEGTAEYSGRIHIRGSLYNAIKANKMKLTKLSVLFAPPRRASGLSQPLLKVTFTMLGCHKSISRKRNVALAICVCSSETVNAQR